MAEIRRVVPSNPISNFRQVAPTGGGLFAIVADLAKVAYERLEPAAMKEMEGRATEEWGQFARQAIGQNRAISLAASTKSPYRDAIASIESAGSGDYAAVGPTHATLGRALGRYQIMEANIGPWSREALGREVSADEFLASPDIQDAVFDHRFGQYVQQFGEEGAAQAWFAGPGGVGKTGRTDSLGTSVGDYTAKFRTALGGERLSSQSPVTTVQTAEGKVEPRLYSPLAGPILQAYNAAAQVAYNAEVVNKAAVDLFDLSNQFHLDPEGYQRAAQGYVDQIVEDAPDQFKAALRGQLSQRASQRFLGMIEERHRDIEARAVNSSTALMDRYQSELAEAIASGDQGAIAAAGANLDDILAAREQLPGIAWTPAQSDNVRIKARDLADREMARRTKEASDELKSQYELAIKAREAGMVPANEATLFSPEAMALHPDLALELQAWTVFSEAYPDFAAGTAAERKADVDYLRSIPVTSDGDVAVVKAAETRNAAISKAWDESPIDAAQEYLPVKPPELPGLDDPNYANAVQARVRYADWLVEQGHTREAVIFNAQEAKELGAALSISSPPEVRLAVAGALVAGLGQAGARGFKQLGDADPVIRHAGMLIARGGSAEVAMRALQGQVLLKEGRVQLPPKADQIAAFDTDMANALAFLPDFARKQVEIMKFAEAIYAAGAQGLDHTSDAAKTAMKEAMQVALGQGTNARGRTTGGVQTVGGHAVLLPPTVSGEDLTDALDRATQPATRDGVLGSVQMTGAAILGQNIPYADTPWLEATQVPGQPPSIPHVAGTPMTRKELLSDDIRFVPVQGNTYRMEVVRSGKVIPVEGADGRMLFVDVDRLIQATR